MVCVMIRPQTEIWGSESTYQDFSPAGERQQRSPGHKDSVFDIKPRLHLV